jgi:outer membrane protein OmpA-like peptidoglycan-associated protein
VANAQNAPGAPLSGVYVSLGGGVGLQQSEVQQPAANLGLPSAKWLQYNTGAAAELSIGWGFGNGLRLDFEVPYLTNQVRGTSGYAVPARAGGSEVKYGGMVNLMYDFNLGLPVTPYVGLGAGGMRIEHDGFNASTIGFTFPHPPGNQTGGDFSYQGILGVSYPLSFVPGLAMTAEYRFVGQVDPGPGYRTSLYNSAGDIVASGNLHYNNDFDHTIMLGLRYALWNPRAAASPPEAQPAVPEVPAPTATRTYLVFFDWDRADLTARARQIIAEAASASTRVQTTRIEVNGYTDLSGSAAYNQRLSVRRAETVAAELVRDGVPDDEIELKGLGESNPLVPTAKGVREPQNRRVEIILQ